MFISGDLLERLCKKTEFEVEGWRKIPPVMEILKEGGIQSDILARLKLNMIQNNEENDKENGLRSIICMEQYKEIQNNLDWKNLGEKTIRKTWIYDHFTKKDPDDPEPRKIAVYVNAGLPGRGEIGCGNVSELLNVDKIYSVGNHCVVVKGIKQWNGKECLEIDDSVGCTELKYIPVDFPFFEEVQVRIKKMAHGKSFDEYKANLKSYGEYLFKMKFGKIEDKWYEKKKQPKKGSEKNTSEEDLPWKYPMLFIHGRFPCFQLKFTA